MNICVCRYGSVFKTSILGTGVIVSTDPEVNKVILQNQGNIFVPAYPKSVRELMGEHSILQMNGNMHRKIHSLLGGFLRSPQFKARITRDIEHSVKQCFATWTHQPIIYLQDQVKKVSLTIFCINNFITTKIKLSSFCPCLIYMLLNFIKLYQIILDCILTWLVDYQSIQWLIAFYFIFYIFPRTLHQITFTILVKVLLSIGPGEDLDFLKREFEEFIKGLICLPLKIPGTRLYKSLKVIFPPTQNILQ